MGSMSILMLVAVAFALGALVTVFNRPATPVVVVQTWPQSQFSMGLGAAFILVVFTAMVVLFITAQMH